MMRLSAAQFRGPVLAALAQVLPVALEDVEFLQLISQIAARKVQSLCPARGGMLRAITLLAVSASAVPNLGYPIRPVPPNPALTSEIESRTAWLRMPVVNFTPVEG